MNEEKVKPTLRMALLCDQVIESKDGTLSIVRVIDRFQAVRRRVKQPAGQPSPFPPPPVWSGKFVLSFIGGQGDFKCKVKFVSPSGKTAEMPEVPFRLDMPERGHNIILGSTFAFDEQGLYWFETYLDDKLVSRVPMRVIIQDIEIEPRPFPKN